MFFLVLLAFRSRPSSPYIHTHMLYPRYHAQTHTYTDITIRDTQRYSSNSPDTCYVNCTFVDTDGKKVVYNDATFSTPGGNYAPAVIGNLSFNFIQHHLNNSEGQAVPFFAYIAPHSPHGPAIPAPWYAHRFASSRAPRTPIYNASAPDHHYAVRSQPPLSPAFADDMDELARNRLRTLLTVDDTLRELYALVEAHGQINNTYWIYTSDHGFHMGAYRLGACKRQPYDSDIRIPLIIHGPGVEAGQVVNVPAGIPDIAPTLLDLAATTATTAATAATTGKNTSVTSTILAVSEIKAGTDAEELHMDGHSLAPLLGAQWQRPNPTRPPYTSSAAVAAASPWRTSYPIEYFATSSPGHPSVDHGHIKDNSNNTFRGVRDFGQGRNLSYFEFTDAWQDWAFQHPNFFELYNLSADPYQATNIYELATEDEKRRLAALVQRYWGCAGNTC